MHRRPGTLVLAFFLLLVVAPAVAGTFEDLVARYRRERGQSFSVRYKTISAIADLGTDRAARFLATVIRKDPDQSIRSNAVYQLARIQRPLAFKDLVAIWRKGDRKLRSSVLNAVASYRKEPVPKDIVKEVRASKDLSCRSALVRIFGRTQDPRFVPEAKRFLADFPNNASFLVSSLMSTRTPPAARLLIRIFDPSRKYDRDSVPKLFLNGPDPIREVLFEALHSTDDTMVDHAISIVKLGKIAIAEQALLTLLAASKGERRVIVIETLGAIGAKSDAAKKALITAVRDGDDDVAAAGARALRSAPTRDAIPVLIDRMEKAKGTLRVEIRATLELITGQQYGDRADLWRRWWVQFGATFKLGKARKPDPNALDTALVNLAIDKGAAAIDSARKKDPPWSYSAYSTGATALVCLALEAAGRDLKDPSLRAGVQYLLKKPVPPKTYEISIEAMALEAIDAKRFRRRIVACGRKLISTQLESGFWSYPEGDGDNSNTQYAVLGLRSAARAGMRIPEKVWRGVRNHFFETRCEDGGWSYRPDTGTQTMASTTSMTAAGISSLLICLENMKLSASGRKELRAVIDRGYGALGKRMKLDTDTLYALYGVERAGVLGSRATMDKKPWYVPGAKRLLSEQDRHGFWTGSYGKVVDTCFAILFLKRFTVPVETK